jgi:hypothetical protein
MLVFPYFIRIIRIITITAITEGRGIKVVFCDSLSEVLLIIVNVSIAGKVYVDNIRTIVLIAQRQFPNYL